MAPVPRSFRRTSLGISVLLSAAVIAPGTASAMVPSKDTGTLSPALARLATPSVRALPAGAQAAALGFARSGPGSLVREGERVLVNVRFGSPTNSGLRALRAIGAVPVSSSDTAGTATVAVDPENLGRLAGVPEVASVTASRAPILYGSATTASAAEGPSCEGGSVISEGLTQLKVDQAREAFGLRGTGIAVGVLSDSFDRATTAADGSGPIATHAAEDVLSGDLPGPGGSCSGQLAGVDVLEDGAAGSGEDEGRAMLQIVHDLAPRASLAFATAFRGEESFAQNIERLAAPVAAGGAGAQENNASTAQVVQLAINRFSGGAGPRLKFALLENGYGVTNTEYPKSTGGDILGPTIFGHAGAAAAIAIAAVPYDDSSEPERYSSRGPVTHYFGPVAGIAPAAALLSPEVVAKPDVAATDCGATTFFAHRYDGITWRFCGTSAAAPHAAAVAALLRQGDPTASGQEIRTALTETAAAVGSFPVTAVGSGLVDAYAAIASLPGPVVAEEDFEAIAIPPVTQPEGPVVEQTEAPLPVAPVPGPPISTPSSTAPPDTFLTRHPRRLVRTRLTRTRLRFRVASDQTGVEFLCMIDRGRFHRCRARLAHRFAIGAHVLRAKARGVDGLVDQSPAVFRFRVKQTR